METRKIQAVDDAVDQPVMDKSDKLTSFRFFAASLASLVVVGFIDSITGYELYMDVFYFIPVSICAWQMPRRDVMVVALLCALIWGGVDFYVGHPYSSPIYWYWNIFIKFSSFLILGLVVQSLRSNLKEQARARRELEKALAELQQSAVEIEKLKNQLQVVCAWSKRIRVEGKWMTFEEFLKDHLHINLSHGMSPEAMDQFAREIEEANKPKQT
jgi:K+-sensing histidine kinase KdpD